MADSWNADVRGEQVLPLINGDATTIRVEAGPGTGKTFGLVRRIERILHPDGFAADGREVLVVAFNRVIAKDLAYEIGERLKTFKHKGTPAIRTIHALCLYVIGEDLRLLLPHEREMLIYDVLEEFPSLRKTYLRAPRAEQALRDHEAGHAEHLELWQAARRWLDRHHARLLGDLPSLFLARLDGGDFPEQSYEYVVVDEFQDLTPAEQDLMFRLRRQDGQLVALGDPRQSIYAFRGNDREGLAKLEDLAAKYGDGVVLDVPMTECQRCPKEVVVAANRLMALSAAKAMVPVSGTPANLHVVTWVDPHVEAVGMAKAIVENFRANSEDQHLVMVTRRRFGYWLRDQIAEVAPDLRIDLSFSEGLLETWAVRETFLFFCLMVAPDMPTWRAWLGYKNSVTGNHYKPDRRNAEAYLKLLVGAADRVTEETIEELASEPRSKARGNGGSTMWDRAARFAELKAAFGDIQEDDAVAFLTAVFTPDTWISAEYVKDTDTARLDMLLLLEKAVGILAEVVEDKKLKVASGLAQLGAVAIRLRQQIATREPFGEGVSPDIQVSTLWGAKGATADHVYLLGACDEAIPGQWKEEYPGTEQDYLDEQRRLFYVSITRSKKTLVISRSTSAATAEAMKIGLAVTPGSARVNLRMSRFLEDIIRQLPTATEGESWKGCC